MKKHIFVSSSLLLAIIVFWGCGSSTVIKDGNAAFNLERYMVASEMLKDEYSKEDDAVTKAKMAFTIGECYRLANFTIEAETWYNDAAEKGYGPEAIFYSALMMKSNEKYQKAMERFNEYIALSPENKLRASRQIKGCELAIEWKAEKTKYEIIKVANINTPYSDFGPTFFENKSIVFTSSREDATGSKYYGKTGDKFFDVFVSNLGQGDRYDEPIPFEDGIINTENNEGAPTFNRDFTEMYFTRCYNKDKKGVDHCKIYKRVKDVDGNWSDAELVELFDDTIDVGHPLLIEDGNRMIFSANNPKGFGGKDLYVTTKTESGWGIALNLGKTVNTSGDEMFPFVDPDGSLYFSSNGHIGMGGLDIFLAEKSGDGWGKVRNMQAPVNSGADDFSLIFDEYGKLDMSGYFEATGYFTSSRIGGMGSDDIYKFILKKPAYFDMIVTVQEGIRSNPSDPSSELIDFKPLKDALVQRTKIDETGLPAEILYDTTDTEGRTFFSLEGETDYIFKASKGTKYIAKTADFSTKKIIGDKHLIITLTLEFVLDSIIEGAPISIPNIYYDFDKWNIRSDAAKVLDEIVGILKDNSKITAEMGSHTDSRGSTSYNEKLSQKRAEQVVKYLSSKGIDKGRLVAKGYGESKLINKCIDGVECTEFEHQKNRRTTFTIYVGEKEFKSYEPELITVDPAMLEKEKKEKEKEKEQTKVEETTPNTQ